MSDRRQKSFYRHRQQNFVCGLQTRTSRKIALLCFLLTVSVTCWHDMALVSTPLDETRVVPYEPTCAVTTVDDEKDDLEGPAFYSREVQRQPGRPKVCSLFLFAVAMLCDQQEIDRPLKGGGLHYGGLQQSLCSASVQPMHWANPDMTAKDACGMEDAMFSHLKVMFPGLCDLKGDSPGLCDLKGDHSDLSTHQSMVTQDSSGACSLFLFAAVMLCDLQEIDQPMESGGLHYGGQQQSLCAVRECSQCIGLPPI